MKINIEKLKMFMLRMRTGVQNTSLGCDGWSSGGIFIPHRFLDWRVSLHFTNFLFLIYFAVIHPAPPHGWMTISREFMNQNEDIYGPDYNKRLAFYVRE